MIRCLIFHILKRVLLFLILILPTSLLSQKETLSFQTLKLDNPDVMFLSIMRDSKGFMWFGSENGLYVYNGYDFVLYTHNEADSLSISNNTILCITEDQNGYLWVGTRNGLNRFDRTTNSFKQYFPFSNNKISNISGDAIPCILSDSQQRLWIGSLDGIAEFDYKKDAFNYPLITNSKNKSFEISCIVEKDKDYLWIGSSTKGLVEYNKTTSEYINFSHDDRNPNSISENTFKSMYFSKKENVLWIGHLTKMLSKFDPVTYRFTNFQDQVKESPISVLSIAPDKQNRLWLASQKMLIIYDLKNNTFQKVKNNPNDLNSFDSHHIQSMYCDNQGIFWFATEGIVYYDPNKDKFNKYFVELPKENNSIKQNFVKIFCNDKNGNLWVGTFGDGLMKIDKKSHKIKRIKWSSGKVFINHIFRDSTNKFWIATGNGLIVFDPLTEKIVKQFNNELNNINSIFHNNIPYVFIDSHGTLWIITQESIDQVDMKTGVYTHHTKDNLLGLSNYKGIKIIEDREGNVWIGTIVGLNKYDYRTRKFTIYKYQSQQKGEINNSFIKDIYVGNNGQLWISTMNGLNRYDSKTNTFESFGVDDGFQSSNLWCIQEDDHNNLWIGSSKGLIKFNYPKKSVVNYDMNDGIYSFFTAFYKDPQGYFFINGRHGDMYSFHPDSIHNNTLIPAVYITDFLLFNKTIKERRNIENEILLNNLYSNNTVELKYSQSVFTFEFSALNYTNPEKNQFRYRLDGFDKEWIVTDYKKRLATYTNLKSGDYIFRVQASNNDGYWNEKGVAIKVKILPPFWRSWIAYIFYFWLIMFILIVFRLIFQRRADEKIRIYLERKEIEKIHEVDQMKLQFFSNISHEFRTPLTLILGPIEHIIKSVNTLSIPESIVNQLKLAYRNSLRLESLITEIMDTFKLDAGGLKIKPVEEDIVKYISDLSLLFQPLAEQKQVTLKTTSDLQTLKVWFDPTMMEKILYNLLSNAFKFTLKGEIKICISKKNGNELDIKFPDKQNHSFAVVSIEDTGCGIPENDLDKIFNRFYQADNQQINRQGGTGLGLALTKELIEMHHGSIKVESVLNEGTCFTFYLPLGNSHHAIDPLESSNEIPLNTRDKIPSLNESAEPSLLIESIDGGDKPIILIVEDNFDLRMYLKSLLETKFLVETAEHGKEGLEKAIDVIPDMIISDVMMPIMNGIEMTRIIKSDSRICHIPIILLTARDSNEFRIEGLEKGAFDYITKPFNEDVLLLKIRNVSDNQEALINFYRSKMQHSKDENYSLSPSKVFIPSADDAFIEKLKKIIEHHISDTDFSVDILATEIGMATRSLHRKILSLLKQTPGDVILEMRLRRSMQLLKESNLSVSEIAYQCGFTNPSYFSKCFKKHYGISPSDNR